MPGGAAYVDCSKIPPPYSFPSGLDPSADAERSAFDLPGVPLVALGPRQCRFVIGDRVVPAIFCDNPTVGGSWCMAHRQLVYTRCCL